MKHLFLISLVFLFFGNSFAQQDGTLDATFNVFDDGEPTSGADGDIHGTVVQTDGKIIHVGEFTSYNGVPIKRIVRVNSNGLLDTTFNVGTGANKTVQSIALQSDGKIVIGGKFTNYDGSARSRIARLNTDGSIDTSFVIGIGVGGILTTTIYSIVIQGDGKIIIGGNFPSYNGNARNGIIRINTDGSFDTTFNTGSGVSSVNAVALQSDGKIIIGGGFNFYNGIIKSRIARLNSDASIDTTFNMGAGASSTLYAIAIQTDGKILIGGDFSSYNGTGVNGIARINPGGSFDSTWNVGTGADYKVKSIAFQTDGKIIIGGEFTSFDGSSLNRLARLDTLGALDVSFETGAGVSGTVETIVIQSDGKIIISGYFGYYNLIERTRVARLYPSGLYDTTYNPNKGANGRVEATAIQSDGKIIIAGYFRTVNDRPGEGIARFNIDGTIDTSFNPVPGTGNVSGGIEAISIQSDDKIIIGGVFTSFKGTSINRIARLNTDGTLDTSFNVGSGTTNPVYATAIQNNGKILIGGAFSKYNNATKYNVARINTDGNLDNSFSIGSLMNGHTVKALAVQSDGKIIIGGSFTINSSTPYNIIRVDSTGLMDTTFKVVAGASSNVKDIVIQSDGKIIIVGYFSSYNGTASSKIARLNSDGTIDTTFNPGSGADSWIHTVSIQNNGKIIIGGEFTSYDGTAVNRIARIYSDGSLDLSFDQGTGADDDVESTAIQDDGKIIVVGNFYSYNGRGKKRVCRLWARPCLLYTAYSKTDVSCNGGTNGNAWVTVNSGGAPYTVLWNTGATTDSILNIAAGTYTAIVTDSAGCSLTDSITVSQPETLTTYNSFGELDMSFDPGSGASNYVNDIAIQGDGKIIIGGGFFVFNGVNTKRIVRLNSDGSRDASFIIGTGLNNQVRDIAIQSDGKILIGGWFVTYNGVSIDRIARLNTDGSLDTTFNVGAGPSSGIQAVVIQTDGKIIIGGPFTSYDGTTINRIARLNTDGSLDTTFNVGTGTDNTVEAIAIQTDGKIIIAGYFTSYNGTAMTRVARLNSDGSLDTSFTVGAGASSNVNAVAVQSDGKIIIGGSFSSFDGTFTSRIARLDSNGTIDPSFNIGSGANGTVNVIRVQTDGSIVIGGAFTSYDGTTRNRIARIMPDGIIDMSFSNGSGASGTVMSLAIQSDEKILMGGLFTSYSGTAISRIARLNISYLSICSAGNGTASVFANGGTTPYTYLWSDTTAQTTATATGLTSGTYIVTVTDANGCDSVFQTSVSIENLQITNNLTLAICDGDSVFLEGGYQNIPGMYYDTLQSVDGCDSILSTVLSFISYSISDPLVDICNGDSADIYGIYRTSAGTYYDSLLTVGGCDSVRSTMVTVNSTNSISDPGLSICIGDSALIYGNYRTSVGTYYDSLFNVQGCDSVHSTVLTVNSTYDITDPAVDICNGDSALIYGNYRTSVGTYYDSLFNVQGCDSVHSTVLTVKSTYSISDPALTICNGDSTLIYGTYRTSTGTYYDSLLTVDGCDSIHSIALTVNPTYSISDSPVSICNGDSSLIYGVYQTNAGTYYNSLTTIDGCDSIYSTLLSINPTFAISDPAINICNGDSVLIYGNYRSSVGTYYDSLLNVDGCDSVHSTVLSANSYSLGDPALAICNGDSALIYGEYRTTAGTYYDSLLAVDGCDSVHSTVLTVNATYAISDPAISICNGDSSLIYGEYRTTAGTYYNSLVTFDGCDSVRTTSLTVDQLPSVTFSGLDSVYCSFDAAVTMIGMPSGGTFSGTGGVTNDQFFPATGINTYTVTYSYADTLGCSNNFSQPVSVVLCTGKPEENGISQLKIYPNPNTGEFNLEMILTLTENFEIKISNGLGQNIYYEQLRQFKGTYKKQLDLKDNPAGVYNLQLMTDNEVITRQIIVE